MSGLQLADCYKCGIGSEKEIQRFKKIIAKDGDAIKKDYRIMIKYTNKYTGKSFDIAKCRESGRRMVCQSGGSKYLGLS